MSSKAGSILETRRYQAFPVLEPVEIERLHRFGESRRYAPDEALVRAGEPGHGLTILLEGQVMITQREDAGHRDPIVIHEPGGFMGELAQLSGRPALVDAHAVGPVKALIIRPERLRALMIAEAELGERIMRALILRRISLIEAGIGGPVIVGRADDGDVLRLEGFLTRNGHPHQRLDPAIDLDAQGLVDRFRVGPEDLPIVLCPNGDLLRNPSENELARCLGLVGALDPARVYDVAVIGAGPAGLATAVYAASEGLSVLVLDCRALGGQAGASARIENYLGFPTGITGMALMGRAYNQASKFGAEMAIPDEVVSLEPDDTGPDGTKVLRLASGEAVTARTVVLACGAQYRKLDVENLADFEAACIHYWASPLEGKLCARQEVALVGGGNSAGQAAVFLASQASKVWLLVRGDGLAASMSRYLVDRIASLSNIEVITGAQVTGLEGSDGILEAITWRRGGAELRQPVRHLFLFIGAEPHTDWLRNSGVMFDSKGFILTGADAPRSGTQPLETTRRGIFAIGDVRSGSVKRVAAAVGEGAQVVAALHRSFAAGVAEPSSPGHGRASPSPG